MKVKNIVFSGFAAAILMGACGAADAATVSLISKDYADTNLQSKLTAGENVTIDNNTISVDLDDYAQKTDVTNAITTALGEEGEVTKAITDAIAGKQDALENADVLSGITAEELSGYDKAVTDSAAALTNAATAQSAAETAQAAADKAQGEVDALETVVATKANAADVYSKTEADNLLAKKADLEDVYLKTETMTTTQINEAIGKIQSGGVDLVGYVKESTYNEGMALKADQADLESVQATANAAATKETVNAIDTRLTAAEGEIDALQMATANLSDFVDSEEIKAYATTDAMNAAIAAVEYDDTALAARVTANEGAISNNATAIETLQNAGYVVGTKTAGSYLVNFDANGNASYASVEIIGSDNSPIDLTTGAVK